MSTITNILAQAEAHTAANRMVDAEQLFRQAIQLDASCAVAHHNLGVALVHQGKFDEALGSMLEAQRLAPDLPTITESLGLVRAILANNRGAELAESGQLDDAADCQREAIELNPRMAQAYCDLGLIRLKQNRLDEAEVALKQAIHLEPSRADAHNHLGVLLARQAKPEQAAASHRRALEFDPTYAEAHYNLGVVLGAMGHIREAITHYRQAITLQPRFAPAHNNLAIALGQEGRLDAAIEAYRKALTINPEFAEACNNLGVALMRKGVLQDAEGILRRAIALKDGYAEAQYNLGTCLIRQARYQDAATAFSAAIEIRADHADAHHNLAFALLMQNKVEESLSASARAIEIDPQHVEAHCNRASALLMLGQFEEGWREFQWRQNRPQSRRPDLPGSLWSGEPLDGRTILISAESGIIDNIQFLRYVPLVHQRGGKVTVECPPWLARLAATCEGVEQTVPMGEPLPQCDVHVPLGSLPGLLGTTVTTIPDQVPYFAPPAAKVEAWREELSRLTGLKVGIAWQSDCEVTESPDCSIPASEFAPLAQAAGVRLLTLQRGGSNLVASPDGGNTITDLGDRLGDATDLAAVLQSLDLVIACDSSVAHLAGALGVPVWAALPSAASWRWMLDRSDSPWYPTMRLYRQTTAGDWPSVFGRMAEDLAALATAHRDATADLDTQDTSAISPPANTLEQPPEPASLDAMRRAQAAEATELAIHLAAEGKTAEAAGHFQRALDIVPDYAPARGNLGNLLLAEGDFDGARACYQAVLELAPRSVEALYSMGVVASEQAEFAEAEGWCREAIALQSDYGDAHYVLATALLRQNRLADAEAAFRRTIELKPEFIGAHLGLAFALLSAGKSAEGWREYEWRSKNQTCPNGVDKLPRWQGEPLAGKTLLVRAEQGFGDTLQFIRYVARLRELGARVIVQCRQPLARLLANCPGVDSVTVVGEPLPAVDLQIPLLSVPGILVTTLDNVPGEVPYLKASPGLSARWRGELREPDKLRIGIVWQGDPTQPTDRFRSFPLAHFAGIVDLQGVQVYSLQFGAGHEQLAEFSGKHRVVDLGDRLGDFYDTAAIVENLDLVITCDSALAHLAGGLGVPVWVALAHSSDWRWMLDRSDSPWYPSMRLFRQPKHGDWASVFREMQEELAREGAAHNRPRPAEAPEVAALAGQQATEPDAEASRSARAAEEETDRGIALGSAGKLDEAVDCLRRAIALQPGNIRAHGVLGNILRQQGHSEEAIRCYRRVLELDPRNSDALYSLGLVAREQERFAEAESWCQQALAINEGSADTHYTLGASLLAQNKVQEAERSFHRAIELEPDSSAAHVGLGFALLTDGRLAEGWAEYEWRLRNPLMADDALPQPRWNGSSILGKTILLRCEQGLGDALQFIRYAENLKHDGATVFVLCKPPLQRLLATARGVDQVFCTGDSLPPFDFYAPLLSLPHLLGISPDNIPASFPYVFPDSRLAKQRKEELNKTAGLKIGIAWHADPTHPVRNRMIPLAEFAGVARTNGVQVYSLQFGHGCEQLSALNTLPIIDLGDRLGDFYNTAAIVENLDLVITCDSAPAHLAGALGKPVWVALPFAADWRWMLDRNDTPWYPTMRLFRQPRQGDWQSVFTAIERELAPLVRQARRRRSNIDQPDFLD